MDDLMAVRFGEACAEVAGDGLSLFALDSACYQAVVQGRAFQELHGEIQGPPRSLCGMDFVNLADVGMTDLRWRGGLRERDAGRDRRAHTSARSGRPSFSSNAS